MTWTAPQPLTAEHALDAFESGVRSLGQRERGSQPIRGAPSACYRGIAVGRAS